MAKKVKRTIKGKEQNDSTKLRWTKRAGDPGLISEKTANAFKGDSIR